MKVMVIDCSGRGHSIADLFVRTNAQTRALYVPGCEGIATPRITSFSRVGMDCDAMVRLARDQGVDLVFVAGTGALVEGFVDRFRAQGLSVLGPDKRASMLESSKCYTKTMCRKYGIPTPDFEIFSDPDEAKAFVASHPRDVVVKADGLCRGDGVFVCDDKQRAYRAIDHILTEKAFGEAGSRIVIEDRLVGRELSFFAITDGRAYKALPLAADYPKSEDGNRGLTCGGIGAFSPHPMETPEMVDLISDELMEPVMSCIRGEELDYTGFIYLGCMLVGNRAYLLEINVRMGDPEAEVVLPRITSDFTGLCASILEGRLAEQSLTFDENTYYCNVVGVQGPTRESGPDGTVIDYPGWPDGPFALGHAISGLERIDRSTCDLFIGEARYDEQLGLVSNGARVIHVVGRGPDLAQAADHAYQNMEHLNFHGMRFRHDIGRLMPWQIPEEI